MKIRNGFVSNSSSSSFCISYKKGQMPRKIVTIDLTEFEDKKIKTAEELKEYVLEQSCFDDIKTMLREDDFWAKKYKDMLLAITNDEELMICQVHSDSENGLEQYIYNKGIGVVTDCQVTWNYI